MAASAARSRIRAAPFCPASLSPSPVSTRQTTDTVVTTESGMFVKERLLPGPYKVKAELTGFKTAVVPRRRGRRRLADAGASSCSRSARSPSRSTVTGGAPLLKTDRADVATRFDSRQLTDLPVLDRNFTKFILLTPGHAAAAVAARGQREPAGLDPDDGQRPALQRHELPARRHRQPRSDPRHHRHQPDAGVDRRDQDHVAELRRGVRPGRSPASSRCRRGRGATRCAAAPSSSSRTTRCRRATRSRSSRRDPLTGKLHSRDQAQPVRRRRSAGRSSQNRWFFFGDYQGTRSHAGRIAAADGADGGGARRRSQRLRRQHLRSATTGRQQFAGNVIPTGRLSPQAQRILDLIPMPNATGRDNGTRDNYVASRRRRRSTRTRSTSASTGGCRDKLEHVRPLQPRRLLPRRSDLVRPGRRAGAGQPGRRLGRHATTAWRYGMDYTLSPTMLADFRFGFFQYKVNVLPFDFGTTPAADAGIPGLNTRLRRSPRDCRPVSSTATARRSRAHSSSDRASASTAATARSIRTRSSCSWSATSPSCRATTRIKFGIDVRRAYNLRVPSDAHRSGELTFASDRTSLQRRRRARPGDVPARRRDAAAPLRQRQHRRARAAVAALLLRAGHLAREQQDDAQLRAAARHHQPADDQRAGQRRLPRSGHRRDRASSASATSAERRRREQAELGAAARRDLPDRRRRPCCAAATAASTTSACSDRCSATASRRTCRCSRCRSSTRRRTSIACSRWRQGRRRRPSRRCRRPAGSRCPNGVFARALPEQAAAADGRRVQRHRAASADADDVDRGRIRRQPRPRRVRGRRPGDQRQPGDAERVRPGRAAEQPPAVLQQVRLDAGHRLLLQLRHELLRLAAGEADQAVLVGLFGQRRTTRCSGRASTAAISSRPICPSIRACTTATWSTGRPTGIASTTSSSRWSRSCRSGRGRTYMSDMSPLDGRLHRRLAVQHQHHHPERPAVQRHLPRRRAGSRYRAEPAGSDRRSGWSEDPRRVVQRRADRRRRAAPSGVPREAPSATWSATPCAAPATGGWMPRPSSTSRSARAATSSSGWRSSTCSTTSTWEIRTGRWACRGTTTPTPGGSRRRRSATPIRSGTSSSRLKFRF